MKPANLLIPLFILCFSSCSKSPSGNSSEVSFCLDEMGNPYQQSDLSGPNVFEHQNSPIRDDIDSKEKKAIRVDTRKNPIQQVNANKLIPITIWIGFAASKPEYASFSSCIPVLSCQLFSGQETDGTYYSYKKLPKVTNADYKVEKYSFPSRNAYYLNYHYKEEIYIDPCQISENSTSSKIERDWGIRMFDTENNTYIEPKAFSYTNSYRFDSFQILFAFSESKDSLKYYIN